MLSRRVPFTFAAVALLAPVLALLLPPSEPLGLLAVGSVVGAVAVALTAHGHRDATASWATSGGPLLYLAAVVLLRAAEGGSVSGYSPLLLLPLFWVALTGDRQLLIAMCLGIAAVLILPIVLVGAPDYPVTEWRRALIWLAVAPTVGLATQDLVRRVSEANEALEGLARTDTLTGLLNRRGFLEVAHREVLRAGRTGEPLVVALLDLDHFKKFNDTKGHPAGDRLLSGAARSWADELREVDVLARWGGEEFIVLLPRCPEAVAHNVLDRVRLATPEDQHCSIGFASWRLGEIIEDTTARADEALYAAKEAGRNQVIAAVSPRTAP